MNNSIIVPERLYQVIGKAAFDLITALTTDKQRITLGFVAGINVLIVTDGGQTSGKMAGEIASALKPHRVTALCAGDFSAEQLLPAHLCFFGAETPLPASFKYLDSVLRHIHLAGRYCGIFANSGEAASYLKEMVRDSEIILHPDILIAGKGDIKKWAKSAANQLKTEKDRRRVWR